MRLLKYTVLATAALALGCNETRRLSTPCGRTDYARAISVDSIDDVDVLLVIDNAEGMRGAQDKLVAELPRMVEALTTGDHDGDGVRDFQPARSLHLGVISTDMGAGAQAGVPTCAMGPGDDGILRRTSNADSPCSPEYPSGTFEFMRGEDSTAFAISPACVASLGTNGCTYAQAMEAALKALTPATSQSWTAPGYSPPAFANDAPPHGLGANAGFLRSNSSLVVIFLTHADDGSLGDTTLMGDAYASESQSTRTFLHPEALHRTDRYVDGLLGLRRNPGQLIIAGLVGLPPETESASAAGDFSALLTHPDMLPRLNETATALQPSCTTIDGAATPPVRFVETASDLAARGVGVSLSSICAASFAPAIDALIVKVGSTLGEACIWRSLAAEPEPVSDCELQELLPPSSTCAELPGRTFVRTETRPGEPPRELCRLSRIRPEDADSSSGWYLVPPDEICALGRYGVSPPPDIGSEMRRACVITHPYPGTIPSGSCHMHSPSCELGQHCAYQRDECGRGSAAGTPLTCDPIAQICTVGCTADSDCDAAGLVGFLCDTGTIGDAQAGYSLPNGIDLSQPRNVCINPSC